MNARIVFNKCYNYRYAPHALVSVILVLAAYDVGYFWASRSRPAIAAEPAPVLAPVTPVPIAVPAQPVPSPVELAAQRAARERAARLATLRTWTPAQRAAHAKACAVDDHRCGGVTLDELRTAASEKEATAIRKVWDIWSAHNIAKKATDGQMDMVHVAIVNAGVSSAGADMLDVLPKTSLAEADKDPSASRGSVANATGTVIEIRKEGPVFEGAIAADGHIVRFITPFPTPGIIKGSRASFRGIFVQEYAYPNVSGGETRSLLLVGTFNR